jgi:hypothetical protein
MRYFGVIFIYVSLLFKDGKGWLQGKVAHFLCHNLIFCRMVCIYMLLTWHKNNFFQICGYI